MHIYTHILCNTNTCIICTQEVQLLALCCLNNLEKVECLPLALVLALVFQNQNHLFEKTSYKLLPVPSHLLLLTFSHVGASKALIKTVILINLIQ